MVIASIAAVFSAVLFTMLAVGWIPPGAIGDDGKRSSQPQLLADAFDRPGALALVGFANLLVTLAIVWKFGWVPKGLHAAILAHALIGLAIIDWRTRWLPDSLTQPVLWLGLLLQLPDMSTIVGADQGLIGAAVGYALPLLTSWLFIIARGKAAIGGGDIKLSAMVGAWLGPGAVLFIWAAAPLGLLMAFLPFSGVGRRARKVAFGPWLAGATLLWLLMIFPGFR